MEMIQLPDKNAPPAPSSSDLILKSPCTRVRRPPNAFMLFARDHRKTVAKQYFDLNNKEVSSILGKIWKNTAENIKSKYYKEAKMLGDLHKTRFPGYVYSPREARLQKMHRKKRREIAMNDVSYSSAETLTTILKNSAREEDSTEKDLDNDENSESKCSPEYVPNNPGYFSHESPEMPNEENDLHHPNGCEHHQEKAPMDMGEMGTQSEMGLRRPMTSERVECCSRTILEPRFRPYGIRDGMPPQLLEHHQHSPGASRSFYNASGHFPTPMKSFCCGPLSYTSSDPRAYKPPCHPYYGPPLMDQYYYPGRDEKKSLAYPAPYHTSELYKTRFRGFDKDISPYCRNPGFGYYTQFNDKWESRINQSEFAIKNPETYSRFSRSRINEENLPYLYPGNFRNVEGVCFQNENFRSSLQNTDYFPYQNRPATETHGIPDSSHISVDEIHASSAVENNFQNLEYPCANMPEVRISSVYTDFPENKHLCHSMNNNINKEYSSDHYSNKQRTQSENISSSVTSLGTESMAKFGTSQCLLRNNVQDLNYGNSFELPTPTMEPTGFSKVELTGPYLKSAVGSFQDKETIECIKKIPETTNEQPDFAAQGKILSERDVENRHSTGSANPINSCEIQMLRKNVNIAASKNLDNALNESKRNNTILSSHQLSTPITKAEETSPDSSISIKTTEESEINKIKPCVSNNFYGTDALLDKYPASSQMHLSGSQYTSGYKKEEVNTSDKYSKNLEESFRNKDSTYSATHLNKNDVSLIKQKPTKVYYQQIDGSYKTQDDKLPEFNTLVSNTPRFVSRSNSAAAHEKEVDASSSVSPVVKVEINENLKT